MEVFLCINLWNFNGSLTNNIVSFEQMGPDVLKSNHGSPLQLLSSTYIQERNRNSAEYGVSPESVLSQTEVHQKIWQKLMLMLSTLKDTYVSFCSSQLRQQDLSQGQESSPDSALPIT